MDGINSNSVQSTLLTLQQLSTKALKASLDAQEMATQVLDPVAGGSQVNAAQASGKGMNLDLYA